MKRAAIGLLIAVAAAAQEPAVENAQLQKHSLSGSVAATLAQFGAGPFWAGYSEPIVPGRHGQMCNWNEVGNAPVRLEGQTAIVVLVRIANSQLDQFKVVSPDCRLDGGGLPFHWIENVSARESIQWLKSVVLPSHSDPAVMAISLHPGAEADAALTDLTALTQPERTRERAAFWIGSARGGKGLETLNRMLASDPSLRVREQVVFAISQSKEPAAVDRLIAAARTDKDPKIRSKALFWMAQKATKNALSTIQEAVKEDPDLQVKEQAVFALKQLPNGEGTPALIQIARNHADPAVRKKAMQWLGQSTDPRAVDFFAQVLKQ